MVVGITEDWTTNVAFDAQLTAVPDSGLYLNQGVHPSLTLGNLLSFLPIFEATVATWSNAQTYGRYDDGKSRLNIASKDGVLYQSIRAINLNHDPAEANSIWWMPTNLESLRMKNFIEKVIERVKSELHLTRRLVNSQSIYEVGTKVYSLPQDYAAWVFQAKGSDYVKIRINQISLQKDGVTPVDIYVVNQGVLVDTLSVTPSNGAVSFQDLGYEFSGQGEWRFIIDATDIYTTNQYINPLRYDGFMVYPASGVGASPQTANFNIGGIGNGLGMNITAYLDSALWIENNLREIGNFVKATFELMAFETFLSNSNNRSNRDQLIQMDRQQLLFETKDLNSNTAAKRFFSEKKLAMQQLSKTFDTQLFQSDDMAIEIDAI